MLFFHFLDYQVCHTFFFFFSSRRRHTRCYRDWSSDVCSSDLAQCGLELRKTRNVTSGEWLLMSLAARRNARRGRFELESFSGRYGRRLLVAPAGRVADLLHRGDAIVAQAMSSR